MLNSKYSVVGLLVTLGALVLLWSPGYSLAQDAVQFDETDRRRELSRRLEALESRLGRYDLGLVEVLVTMAESSAELNLHAEASALLDRAILIQRQNLGLYTPAQIPLHFAQIEHEALTGDWPRVNEALAHLYWLLVEKQAGPTEDIIANLVKLSEVHLKSVPGDLPSEQARHYRSASDLTYLALSVSERLWGEEDPRRIDLLYSLLKQFYLQSVAVERLDDTAYALRAIVPGSSWVRPRRLVRSRYFGAGLRLLEEIARIVEQSSIRPEESLAMVQVYGADWHLLFNHAEAEALYARAHTALQSAGAEDEALARLFAEPQLLPAEAFYDNVGQALTAGDSRLRRDQLLPDGERGNHYVLEEWFDAMPTVPFPLVAPQVSGLSMVEHRDSWLRFSLRGLDTVSRWVNGRYQTHRGVPTEFEAIDVPQGLSVSTLGDRLHNLHFRPVLEAGRAQPAQGLLLYRAGFTPGGE